MLKFSSKFFLLLTIFFYCLYYLYSPAEWHFIDNVNLLIHEAGHWIFAPFGEFVSALGGSLNQILVPLVFVFYFYSQSDIYSSAIVLFWTGINFVNISIYAGDAVKMQLQLLGGGTGWDTGMHDWNYLLVDLGLLHYTNTLAITIKIFGILCFILAFLLGTKTLFQEFNRVDYEQK